MLNVKVETKIVHINHMKIFNIACYEKLVLKVEKCGPLLNGSGHFCVNEVFK